MREAACEAAAGHGPAPQLDVVGFTGHKDCLDASFRRFEQQVAAELPTWFAHISAQIERQNKY